MYACIYIVYAYTYMYVCIYIAQEGFAFNKVFEESGRILFF